MTYSTSHKSLAQYIMSVLCDVAYCLFLWECLSGVRSNDGISILGCAGRARSCLRTFLTWLRSYPRVCDGSFLRVEVIVLVRFGRRLRRPYLLFMDLHEHGCNSFAWRFTVIEQEENPLRVACCSNTMKLLCTLFPSAKVQQRTNLEDVENTTVATPYFVGGIFWSSSVSQYVATESVSL